jgi:hypothetical protein
MMIKQISTNCNAYSLYNNKLKKEEEEEENHDETINKKTKSKNHLKSQDDCILFCLSVIFSLICKKLPNSTDRIMSLQDCEKVLCTQSHV